MKSWNWGSTHPIRERGTAMTTDQISYPQTIQPLIRPLNDDGFVLTGF